jgi:hypothetical protein
MPELPKKKVGLIACSGEELAAGTLTRVAMRLVLEKLRPADTVTLCLPLFLAGEEGERAFARFYPTVAVDGCGQACAQRATEKFSAPVAAALRVDELLAEMGVPVNPAWRRSLDAEGWAVAERLAEVIAARVDALLGTRPAAELAAAVAMDTTAPAATCACATQIPVSRLVVAGEPVELTALLPIFDQFYQAGQRPGDGIGPELLAAVRVYNPVPDAAVADYQAVLEREYTAFYQQRSQP